MSCHSNCAALDEAKRIRFSLGLSEVNTVQQARGLALDKHVKYTWCRWYDREEL